jgi:hypothetical protein
MRRLLLIATTQILCIPALGQTGTADEALLVKTRALYDAPFSRGLVSFDCAVEFDWRKHFLDFLGTMPPAAIPIADRLQAIGHRVFVDRNGAIASAIPTTPDLKALTTLPTWSKRS